MPLRKLLDRERPPWATGPDAEFNKSRVERQAGRWMRLLWIVPILGGMFLIVDRALTQWTAPSEPLRVALNPWPGYGYATLAEELGFFEAEGVNVRLVEFRSLATVRRAFERRQVDGFFGTLIEVLQAHEQSDRAPRMAFATDYSNGAHEIIAHSTIASLRELRGKTVAVEPGTLSLYLLSRGLDRVDLTLDDVHLQLATVGEMPQFLRDHLVDAVVIYPPSSVELKHDAPVKSIFSSAEIPREILDILAFSDDVCRRRPRDIAACLRGYCRAQEYAHDHPHDAIQRMSRTLGVSPEYLQSSIEKEIRVLSAAENATMFAERRELIQNIDRVVDVLLKTKELTRRINPIEVLSAGEEL